MTFPANSIYIAAALLLAATGAAYDLRTRRIPNGLTGPALLFGLLLHLALGGWAQLGWAAAAAAIPGGFFLIFYLAGGMGAGDVKLMTAVAAIAGPHSVVELLAMTAIMGGILALALAIWRGRLRETLRNVGALLMHHRLAGLKPHPELNLGNAGTLRLPYGAAIAAGSLVTFLTGLRLR